MNLFNKLKNTFTAARQAWNLADDKPVNTIKMSDIIDLFSSRGGGEYGDDLGDLTYLTCLKVLSESIGKIPVYLITDDKQRVSDHETSYILNVRPNQYQTPAQFFTFLEYCRNHYGNAFSFVNRLANGNIEGLYPLYPQAVQIWINNTDKFTDRTFYYSYTDTKSGKLYWISPEDMLHFKSWITESDGLSGRSVRSILTSTLLGAKASSKYLNELYTNGMVANLVINYVGDLNQEAQDMLLETIEKQARMKNRKMITLPADFKAQPLDLKLTDSQFVELRRLTSLQVAAAFGINPDHINDYSKSSYASSAMQNLSFYINTLLYNVSCYEQELRRKLLTRKEIEQGLKYKFNVAVILRGDPMQQADVLQKLVQAGIYSVNDALALLDRPPCDNGDVHMVNGSYVRLENIGEAYKTNGGEENAKNKE